MRETPAVRAAREVFLADVLDVALTGSEHWNDIEEEYTETSQFDVDYTVAWIRIVDPLLPTTGPVCVTPKTIAQGYRVLMSLPTHEPLGEGSMIGLTRGQIDRLLDARALNSPAMVTEQEADALLQLGMFGVVRYAQPSNVLL